MLLSSKVTAELAAAVDTYAASIGETRSHVVAKMLEAAMVDKDLLEALEADLEDEGYQDGLRRGLHEVHQHMKKLYGGK